MSRAMLRRVSVAILLLAWIPQTVHAFDHHEHHHHDDDHGSGGGCSGPSASTPSPSPASRKRVFATSTTHTGALGGAIGADNACELRAAAGGLPGVFRAWLSDGPVGAYDRTADSGPWYTTSDALAFSSRTDLRGAPRSELLDEYGGHAERAGAWSGSDAGGATTGHDCDGWTSAASEATGTPGNALAVDTTWGGGGAPRSCNVNAPLICFQQ